MLCFSTTFLPFILNFQVTYDKSGLLRCPHFVAPCIFRVRKSKKNFLLDGLIAVKTSHLHV